MNKKSVRLKLIVCSLSMLVFILDSRTAAAGAAAGVELCLKSVIPSLFPAMVMADILSRSIPTQGIPFLSPLRKLCGIPAGTEGILLAGILSGYPVGAKLTGQYHHARSISQNSAEHMLSFCSNAGPAFIFGICGGLFSWFWAPYVLWLIHVFSAILVGICFKKNTADHSVCCKSDTTPITAVVSNCTKAMGIICGWIIIFRVIFQFMTSWFLWLFPPSLSALICGVMELTNGCILLSHVNNEPLRFLICNVLLSFGGICILLQTAAVSDGLGLKPYIKGKLLQTLFSFLLASSILMLADHSLTIIFRAFGSILTLIIIMVILICSKKHVAFRRKIIYNTRKTLTR